MSEFNLFYTPYHTSHVFMRAQLIYTGNHHHPGNRQLGVSKPFLDRFAPC